MPLPGDEGGLLMRIDVKQDGDHKDLVIDFGKPTAWIGFHVKEVEQLIGVLQERLKEMKDDDFKPKLRFNPN